jgi:beta-galactosidase/beta-glucuronidase
MQEANYRKPNPKQQSKSGVDSNEVLADDRYKIVSGEAHQKIALSDSGIDDSRNELLWSPERPTLLDVEVLLWRGDTILDSVRSYTALRSVNINRDRFMLNGPPLSTAASA